MTAGGATTAVSEHDHTVPIPRQPEPVSADAVSSDAISPAPGEPLAAAEDQLADP
ncbi:MAG: hypothetical protein QOJ50_2133, partial [Cryptosporangiaceae bacterium]|nr:hypothetical protein [Cryptosporangiaceae bacterium]